MATFNFTKAHRQLGHMIWSSWKVKGCSKG